MALCRHISSEGIEELKKMESVEPVAYTCSAGHLTIGVGHKLTAKESNTGLLLIDGKAVPWADGLTPEQINDLLRADLETAEWVVESCVKAPLTDNQFAALVSLCFNIGGEAFKNSSVVRVINKGEFHLVPGFLRMWNKISVQICDVEGCKIQKRVSKGLVNRREAEIRLFLKP